MQKKSLTWSAGGEGARLLINQLFSCFPCLWVYSSVFCFVWWYSLLQVHSLSVFVFPSGFLFSSGFRVQFPPVFPRSFRVPLSPSVLWFLPRFLACSSPVFFVSSRSLSLFSCWVPPVVSLFPVSFPYFLLGSPSLFLLSVYYFFALGFFFFLLCFLCFWVNFSSPFSPEILPWFWVFFSIL